MTIEQIRKLQVKSDYPHIMNVTKVLTRRYAPNKYVTVYVGSTQRILRIETAKEHWYEVKPEIWKTETKTLTWDVFDGEIIRKFLDSGDSVRLFIAKGKRCKRDYTLIDPHSNRIESYLTKTIDEQKDIEFEEISTDKRP